MEKMKIEYVFENDTDDIIYEVDISNFQNIEELKNDIIREKNLEKNIENIEIFNGNNEIKEFHEILQNSDEIFEIRFNNKEEIFYSFIENEENEEILSIVFDLRNSIQNFKTKVIEKHELDVTVNEIIVYLRNIELQNNILLQDKYNSDLLYLKINKENNLKIIIEKNNKKKLEFLLKNCNNSTIYEIKELLHEEYAQPKPKYQLIYIQKEKDNKILKNNENIKNYFGNNELYLFMKNILNIKVYYDNKIIEDFYPFEDFPIIDQMKFIENKIELNAKNQSWIAVFEKEFYELNENKTFTDNQIELKLENIDKIHIEKAIYLNINNSGKTIKLKKPLSTQIIKIKKDLLDTKEIKNNSIQFVFKEEVLNEELFLKDYFENKYKENIKLDLVEEKFIDLSFKIRNLEKDSILIKVNIFEKVELIIPKLYENFYEMKHANFKLECNGSDIYLEKNWFENNINYPEKIFISFINPIFKLFHRQFGHPDKEINFKFTQKTMIKDIKDYFENEENIPSKKQIFFKNSEIILKGNDKLVDFCKNNVGFDIIFMQITLLKEGFCNNKKLSEFFYLNSFPIVEQKIYFEKFIDLEKNQQLWCCNFDGKEIELDENLSIEGNEDRLNKNINIVSVKRCLTIGINFGKKIEKIEKIPVYFEIEKIKKEIEKKFSIKTTQQKLFADGLELKNNVIVEQIAEKNNPIVIDLNYMEDYEFFGFSNKEIIDIDIFQKFFLERINEVEEIIEETEFIKNENMLNYVESQVFQKKISYVLFSLLKKHAINMWDKVISEVRTLSYQIKNVVNLWEAQIAGSKCLFSKQFLIHYYINSGTSDFKYFFLKSIKRFFPVPLYYNVWENNFEIERQEIVKELGLLVQNCFVVISVGLGSCGEEQCGKSEILNKIFATNFSKADNRHPTCDKVPEIRFDLLKSEIYDLAIVDIPSKTDEKIKCELMDFANILILHKQEKEMHNFDEKKYESKKIKIIYTKELETICTKENEDGFEIYYNKNISKQNFDIYKNQINEFVFENLVKENNYEKFAVFYENHFPDINQINSFLKKFTIKKFIKITNNFKNYIDLQRKTNLTEDEENKYKILKKFKFLEFSESFEEIIKILENLDLRKETSTYAFFDIFSNFLKNLKIKKI